VRVCIHDRTLQLATIAHNVPPSVCWQPEQAAAHFVDDPDAFIYVSTFRWGGVHYLHALLVEMDLIDPIAKGNS
jgi:hypothetical protein